MRYAGLVMMVGCATPQASPIVIDVVVQPTVARYFITPSAGCTCHNIETFPAVGSCTQDSDAGPLCTCELAPCLTSVSLLQDGVADPTARWFAGDNSGATGKVFADFTRPGLSLRFDGCDDAALALDSGFPPQLADYAASSDMTSVTWPLVANDGFLVETGNMWGGELCRTAPDTTSQPLHITFEDLAVRALRGPISTRSSTITFQRWQAN